VTYNLYSYSYSYPSTARLDRAVDGTFPIIVTAILLVAVAAAGGVIGRNDINYADSRRIPMMGVLSDEFGVSSVTTN